MSGSTIAIAPVASSPSPEASLEGVLQESMAVDEAATRAIALIQELSNATSMEQARNPEEMYKQLDSVRNNIMMAWDRLQQAIKIQQQQADTTGMIITPSKLDFRPAFMDMITEAFGDVLDDLRQSEDVDINILIDCLQSGMELMTTANDDEDFAFWHDDDNDDDNDQDDNDEMEQDQDDGDDDDIDASN